MDTQVKRQSSFDMEGLLACARGGHHGLFIEMKRQVGGSVEPEQKEWHERLTAQGYLVVVCRGLGDAMRAITDYLEPRKDIACGIHSLRLK